MIVLFWCLAVRWAQVNLVIWFVGVGDTDYALSGFVYCLGFALG